MTRVFGNSVLKFPHVYFCTELRKIRAGNSKVTEGPSNIRQVRIRSVGCKDERKEDAHVHHSEVEEHTT